MSAQVLRVEIAQAEVSQSGNVADRIFRNTLEAHAPVGVLPRGDVFAAHDFHVRVALITSDGCDQGVDDRLIALEYLKERAVAIKKHSREALARVIAVALRDECEQAVRRESNGFLTEISDPDHGRKILLLGPVRIIP